MAPLPSFPRERVTRRVHPIPKGMGRRRRRRKGKERVEGRAAGGHLIVVPEEAQQLRV